MICDHDGCYNDAPFYTELYLPYSKELKTVWLCKRHQALACATFLQEVGLE